MNIVSKYLSCLALLCGTGTAAVAQDELHAKPVASFHFDHSLSDAVSGRQARARGWAYTTDRFGNPDHAVYLQGNPDSYVNLGTGPELKMKFASISLWVKVDQPLHKGFGLLQNPVLFVRSAEEENCNEAYYVGYHIDLEKINVNTSTPGGKQVTLYPAEKTRLMQWHHVVMTYDDDTLCYYLDGVLRDKAVKKFRSTFLESDSVLVGNRMTKLNHRFLNGCVDDIEFFDHVITPAEVKDLYEAPDPNFYRIWMRWIGYAAGFAGLLLLVILYFQYRLAIALKAQREQTELKYRWSEMENRVLSAQMDPHFIFNSLNTIQQFIITDQNEKAQLYLTKFSRLLRRILESNTKSEILLSEEIEIIEKYIEIESLRFNRVFTYTLKISDKINPAKILIPHFLLQPLIENAIWHGLLPKDGEKLLVITFDEEGPDLLKCIIADNGVGRQAASSGARLLEKKSLAIGFIRQRLELFATTKRVNCRLEIRDETNEDGSSAGTTVIISIPIL